MGGVSSGGLGLIVQLVKRLKVAERIDERVRVLKRHLPYRESDHVLNLIYNVMSGGVCLQDVKSRREDVSYLESVGARKIPAPSTEGDFLRRFKQEDVLALQEAFNESHQGNSPTSVTRVIPPFGDHHHLVSLDFRRLCLGKLFPSRFLLSGRSRGLFRASVFPVAAFAFD